MSRPWSERDKLDAIRWYTAGMSFKCIGQSMSPPRHHATVASVLHGLGYGLAPPMPADALARAKSALAEQIALAKREAATAPPFKGQL